MTLGQTIKHARITHDLKQRELSTLTRISQKYLSQIENDHVDPAFSYVVRIMKALPLDLSPLLTAEEDV